MLIPQFDLVSSNGLINDGPKYAIPSSRAECIKEICRLIIIFLASNNKILAHKMVGRSQNIYNVNVNDDIIMIERVETAINMLNSNYNRYCPFCILYGTF